VYLPGKGFHSELYQQPRQPVHLNVLQNSCLKKNRKEKEKEKEKR
jgi:hypothetical protein